jgi:hypothetical protein
MEIFSFHPLAMNMRVNHDPLPDLEHSLGGWVLHKEQGNNAGSSLGDKAVTELFHHTVWSELSHRQQFTFTHSASWTLTNDALIAGRFTMSDPESAKAFWKWYLPLCPHFGTEFCDDTTDECGYDSTMYWNCVHPVGHGFVTHLIEGVGHDICLHGSKNAIPYSPEVMQTAIDWCQTAPTKTSASMCVMGAYHHFIKRADTHTAKEWFKLCELMKTPHNFWCGYTQVSVMDGGFDFDRVAIDMGLDKVPPTSTPIFTVGNAATHSFEEQQQQCVFDELGDQVIKHYKHLFDFCKSWPNIRPVCVQGLAAINMFKYDQIHTDCYWATIIKRVQASDKAQNVSLAQLEAMRLWAAGDPVEIKTRVGEGDWPFMARVFGSDPFQKPPLPLVLPPAFFISNDIPPRRSIVDLCSSMSGDSEETWMMCMEGIFNVVFMTANLVGTGPTYTLQLCEQFATGERYSKVTWERAHLLCVAAMRQKKAPFPGAAIDYAPGFYDIKS